MKVAMRWGWLLAVPGIGLGLGVPCGGVSAARPATLQAHSPDSSSLRSEVEGKLVEHWVFLNRQRRSGITDPQAESRQERRAGLIALLDRVAVEIPGDDFVVGHRVGARLLQGPKEAALEAARECEGSRWWCLELEGTVLHYMGEVEAADSVFDEALEHMPRGLRCERESVGDLLDGEARQQYGFRSCAGQRPINDRFWWLAEPLYIVPGHNRRTEHRARFVSREWNHAAQAYWWRLSRPLSNSEGCWGGPKVQLEDIHPNAPLWRESSEAGRTVRRRTRAAREFPRRAIRVGHATPWGHNEGGTFCTLVGEGYSFAPDWAMLEDPLGTSPAEWRLERTSVRVAWEPDPPELYDPPYGPMTSLDQQVGFFRRGDSVVVVAATALAGTPLAEAGAVTVGVVLAQSEHDTPVMELQESPATDSPFRFRLKVPESRYLVSVEAVAEEGGAGRTRFGAGLPEGATDGLAVSDLLLFDWAEEGPDEVLDRVQPRMLPTTRLPAGAEVGLYWEVYGVEAGEPLTVAVRTTTEDPGLLRRIGRALRLTRGDGGVQVSWEDAADGAPHTSRTLRVDLGGLSEGRHTLEVTVETADGRAAATRGIVIGEG